MTEPGGPADPNPSVAPLPSESAVAGRPRVVWLALGLALGPAVALGLARFAYSLLLPAMRTDLGWSFGQAGTMNTANALGYLAGAMFAAPLAGRLGTRRSFAAGMALDATALLGAGFTASFGLQLVLRLAAGIGSAATFIGGAGLVATLGRRAPARAGTLLSVYTAGAGAGIVVSGLTVAPLLAAIGPGGWRWAWFSLAALAAASLLAALPSLRRTAEPTQAAPAARRREPRPVIALLLPALGYLLFGGGYIAYVTFIIADVKAQGFSATQVTVFWSLLGITVLAGVPLWGRLLDRLRSGHALALMTAVLAAGSALPLLAGGLTAGMASAVIFGSSFLAVPAGMAHLARRQLPPEAWNWGIAALTVVFALGQSAGPGLAGILADRAGGPSLGLVLATITLAVATAVYLTSTIRLHPPATPPAPV
ncbi:MAG: YbfB/YjiJ family MFS transporter [Sciscionella sp.]